VVSEKSIKRKSPLGLKKIIKSTQNKKEGKRNRGLPAPIKQRHEYRLHYRDSTRNENVTYNK
jgi:hypothetical protein